ncbi:MAG: hypothetical protein OIF32_01260 [Campylobacterales bacterium]|nr:hypothetical protein [Campylobacterales bacterium]
MNINKLLLILILFLPSFGETIHKECTETNSYKECKKEQRYFLLNNIKDSDHNYDTKQQMGDTFLNLGANLLFKNKPKKKKKSHKPAKEIDLLKEAPPPID